MKLPLRNASIFLSMFSHLVGHKKAGLLVTVPAFVILDSLINHRRVIARRMLSVYQGLPDLFGGHAELPDCLPLVIAPAFRVAFVLHKVREPPGTGIRSDFY